MAVTRSGPTPPPTGATWALVAGLALVYLGERVLSHLPGVRLACAVIGGGTVLAMTVWRALAAARQTGAMRRVEGLLLAGSAGCALALGIYFVGALRVGPEHERLAGALTVAWLIVLGVSLIPLLFTQWTAARGTDEGVEEVRVREAATSGLTVALAAAFLFVLGFIASERDVKLDVSYFRTSLPGTATEHMVEGLSEPLRVLLFFPEVNDVKSEVTSYFEELARTTGRVEIEAHDRMAAPKLAKEHNVYKDGTVVLVKGKQSENIVLDPQMQNARTTLRVFDSEVQKALMKIARGARVAYLTSGHGEMNDPPAAGAPADPMTSATLVRELLTLMNYRVSELGVKSGLATDVPDDAVVVLVLGPKKPFLDEELAALDRYLARGGALFLALDATGEFKPGPLEQRLGVRFDPTLLADDRQHLRQRNNASDNRLLVTDQFSAHASVTTLARSHAGAGIVAPSSGSLVDVDLKAAPEDQRPKRTYVVRSLTSTFADKNGNDQLDGDEKRASYNLVAAVEASAPPADAAPSKDHPPRAMRAFVLAAATMVSDVLVANVPLNAALVGDGVKWLGGEEQLAGETTSEKDVAIEHTRSTDVAWFYGTVVGAPLLVLGGGLAFTARRRRRRT
jgi:hypothetical protein